MSLAKGDHLVIKRGDQIIGPENEAYHEFEVMDQPDLRHPVPPEGTSYEAMEDKRPIYLLPSGIRVVR